jgi:hypothetical protein
MAAKVEIIYEAEATSLKATVNEVNKANDAVVVSAQESSKKVADTYKNAGKSIAAAFSGSEVKKALADQNKAFDDLNKKGIPLTRVLRGLKNDLNALEEAGKGGTAQFKKLEIEAARLEDQIGDTRARVKILASDTFKFDAAVEATQALASGFEIAQGASALFGSESEDLQKVIAKTTAITAIANGVNQLAKQIKEESALKTQVLSKATAAYNLVVGESTGLLKGFRIALAATGVGLLVIAIGALIANFDKLKDAITGTSDTSRLLDATLEETKTALGGAIEETTKVGNAFELARKGVISKEEALLTYNETLGGTFGKTNDLNAAEKTYNEKTAAYLQATALRAQAQALLAKSAALAAEAATVTGEQATNFGEKIQTFITDASASFFSLLGSTSTATVAVFKSTTAQVETEAQKRVRVELEAQSEIAKNLFTAKLEEAEVIENAAGILSEAEQTLRDEREKKEQEAAAKRKAAAEKAAQDQLKAREQLLALELEALNSQLDERGKILDQSNKEILALEKSFRESNFKEGSAEQIEQQKKLSDAIELIKINANKQITAIEIAELEKRLQKQLELSKAGADATLQQQLAALQIQQTLELETADKLGKSKVEIANKYAPQIEAINKQIAAAELNTQINTIKTLEIEQGSTLDRRIELINIEAEARRKAATDSIKDEKERASAIELINAETEAAIREERRKTTQQTIDDALEIADQTVAVINTILDFQKQASENRINDITATKNVEIEAINQTLDTERDKQKQREAAELRASKRINEEKTKQAKRDKAQALFQAGIDLAVSILKTGAQLGYPAAIPFQVVAGIVGAVQIAAIASKPIPKFKKGGIVGGQSHEAGGTMIEAEKGEFVVNRSSVARHRDALDAMNRSSAAFKKYVDERYVRPALMDFAAKNRGSNVTVNASLNSKSMEKEIKGLRKDLKGKSTVVNINSSDSRYEWHRN